MHPITTTLAIATVSLLSACTKSDDLQLSMCQALANQLTANSVSSWDTIEQNNTDRLRTIDIAYGAADSSAGSISCTYPIDKEGVVDTSPNTVVHNGQTMGTRELVTVGMKASAALLKGTAANTVAKSRELANEAGRVAGDVAEKALDAATETSKTLQQKLDN